MKTKLLISGLLVFCCCARKQNTQDKIVVANASDDTAENISTDDLHREYQNYSIGYYNDLDYLGIGVVNPKDYTFQVITDTIMGERFVIDNIENLEYLVPILWKPDYLIFYMPVVCVSNNYYEVQGNAKMRVFVSLFF